METAFPQEKKALIMALDKNLAEKAAHLLHKQGYRVQDQAQNKNDIDLVIVDSELVHSGLAKFIEYESPQTPLGFLLKTDEVEAVDQCWDDERGDVFLVDSGEDDYSIYRFKNFGFSNAA